MSQDTLIFLLFLSWILLGSLCSRIARQKNRHPGWWFVIGFVLGIFGIILLYILPEKKLSYAKPIPKSPNQDKQTLPTQCSSAITPPSNDPEMSKYWYYLDKDRLQKGPISFDALHRKYQGNDLSDTTYVWSEDMIDWKRINELPEKFKQLSNN